MLELSPLTQLVCPSDARYNYSMNQIYHPFPVSCTSSLAVLASCLLLSLTACAPQPLTVTREPVTLRLVAADSCESLADELAQTYEDEHPWVTVELETWNSLTAEQTLQAGEADLALLSWIANGENDLWAQPFAHDNIAVIVHPEMPFTEIGLALLQEIFQGRVQEWGDLVLTVVSREEGSGTRATFDSVVLGNYQVTRTGVVMSSGRAVVEYVARTPGAIGYVPASQVSDSDGVRILPLEGVSPAADSGYPLPLSLYLATVSEPAGAGREFAQWVLGPAGQRNVTRLLGR